MKTGILYISCGAPGSGKSTYLKSHIKPDEKIISRDEIRFALLKEGEDYFSHEKEVFNIFINEITKNINAGINVYADATHLNFASRKKLTDALLEAGCDPIDVQAIFFDVPLTICFSRNEKRKGTKTYVPQYIIRRMFRHLEFPTEFSTIWIVDKDNNLTKWAGE